MFHYCNVFESRAIIAGPFVHATHSRGRPAPFLVPGASLSHDPLTYEDLLRIVELVKSSEQFSEFRLKVGDIEVELRRRVPDAASGGMPQAPRVAAPPPVDPSASAPPPTRAAAPVGPSTSQPGPSRQAPGTDAGPDSDRGEWPADAIVIRAPMVGTFYRAPEPGARPFVVAGDRVSADATVCIIEVMKLMNSIPAGAKGVVTQILVEDGAPVEANAALIVLAPIAGDA